MRSKSIAHLVASLLLPAALFADIIIPPTPTGTIVSDAAPHLGLPKAFADVVDFVPIPHGGGTFPVFIVSLIATVIIEFCVIYFWARKHLKLGSDFSHIVAASVLPSAVTLGCVFLFGLHAYATWPINLPLLEIGIVLVEALFIQKILKVFPQQAILVSFTANLASFLCGLIGIPSAVI